MQPNFSISLKYSNLGITPVKNTEILRNLEKDRRKFNENLQNMPSLSKINKNCVEFCKNCANVLKNHRNLEWCKRKNVDLVKSFPVSIYLQNLASMQPRTSLRKVQKMYALKDRVGDSTARLERIPTDRENGRSLEIVCPDPTPIRQTLRIEFLGK